MNQDIIQSICDYLDNQSLLRWSSTCSNLYHIIKFIPLPELIELTYHFRKTTKLWAITTHNYSTISRLANIKLQDHNLLTLIPHMSNCQKLTLFRPYSAGGYIVCELPSCLRQLDINDCFIWSSNLFGTHGLSCLNIKTNGNNEIHFTTSHTMFYKLESCIKKYVQQCDVQLPSNLHTLMVDTYEPMVIDEEIPYVKTLHLARLCPCDLRHFTHLKTLHVNDFDFVDVLWPSRLKHLHFKMSAPQYNLPTHITKLTIDVNYDRVDFHQLGTLNQLHTLILKGTCKVLKHLPSSLKHLYIDHFTMNLPKLPSTLQTLHIYKYDRDYMNPWPASLIDLYIPHGKSTRYDVPEGLLHLTLKHYEGFLPATLKTLALKKLTLKGFMPSIQTCRYIPHVKYYAEYFDAYS